MRGLGSLPLEHTRPQPPPERLRPRGYKNGGSFVGWESSRWFQAAINWCVDKEKPFEPLSTKGHACGFILDFGLTLITEVMTLKDTLICVGTCERATKALHNDLIKIKLFFQPHYWIPTSLVWRLSWPDSIYHQKCFLSHFVRSSTTFLNVDCCS